MNELFDAKLPEVLVVSAPIVDPPFPGWPSALSDAGSTAQERGVLPTSDAKPKGEQDSLDALFRNLRELQKQAADDESYRKIIRVYGGLLTQKAQSNPELLEALKALLNRYGIDLDSETPLPNDDRVIPQAALGGIAVIGLAIGAAIGWYAED